MAIAGGLTVTSLPAQSQDQSQRQAGQTAQGQPAQGQAGEAVKNWKDRAEYDLYRAIVNEQDPASVRLRLLPRAPCRRAQRAQRKRLVEGRPIGES